LGSLSYCFARTGYDSADSGPVEEGVISVKSKCVCLAMLVFLSLVLGKAGSAQELQPLEPEWLRQMYEEGWQKVQEGVLQRDTGGGKFETFGYGAEGLRWVVQGYEMQLSFFEGRYSEWPTAELAEAIAQLKGKIDRLNAEISSTPPAESFNGEALTACTVFDESKQASAGPLETTQGVKAEASASFSSDCFIGDTFAVAHAEATDAAGAHNIATQEVPKNGTSINSHATASAAGVTNCYSWAQASVSYEGSTYLTPLAENYSCPNIPPVEASISGPTSFTTDYYISSGCANVTWTASATGGHPGYTYNWYIGTDPTVQGTGSTFTKSYCNTNQFVTVKVVASDSDGHTDDETYTTNIQFIGPVAASISGPASVTTDYYGPTCVNVTWSASATGGHPGYTYSWYLGTSTGTTAQGTGPTFTKSLCSTDQSVTVKVIDSDGHTGNKTFTTSVQYKPAIAAKIAGPTSVSSSTSCTTVSWTAGVTSTGHPGLSYKWYIGTVQQATGTTFSKQFCSSGGTSQSVTVKATATASDGHQDTDTHTTTITFPMTATIDGPSEVYGSKCATATWTASVSGGTPAYSYSWTIDSSTTVVSTTSSLTRSYCGTRYMNVKLTVRDSASQTATATFTTLFESGI
jgi:hypothetical protein